MNHIIADDDLDIFFDDDEFATSAKFFPNGQSGRDVKVHLFLEDAVDTIYYMIYGRAADLRDIAIGDHFIIDGTEYGVTNFTVDEFGLTIAVTVNKEG